MAKTDDRLLDRARRMRREPTEAEAMLWRHLRDRKVGGVKFARQVVIGPYIADFAARSAKIVVEVDGDTHADLARDKTRTTWLRQRGYRVMRFTNADVMTNMDGVWQIIAGALGAAPHPDPLPAEGREQKDFR